MYVCYLCNFLLYCIVSIFSFLFFLFFPFFPHLCDGDALEEKILGGGEARLIDVHVFVLFGEGLGQLLMQKGSTKG